MLTVMCVAGIAFSALMSGIVIGVTDGQVTWSDAVSAIAAVAAAIGTVGTLGYQAVQHNRLQRQVREQSSIRGHAEGLIIKGWFNKLDLMGLSLDIQMHPKQGEIHEKFEDSWNALDVELRESINNGKSSIATPTAYALYRVGWDLLIQLEKACFNVIHSRHKDEPEFATKNRQAVKEIRSTLNQSKKVLNSWLFDLERQLPHHNDLKSTGDATPQSTSGGILSGWRRLWRHRT